MAIENEVIWITGASSGLGLALAHQLAPSNKVIVSARNQAALMSLAATHPNIEVVVFDVTDQHAVAAVQQQLKQLTPHLDRVILNAGNCEYFDIDQPDWAIMTRMMQVNFIGMVNSLDACLPLLKAARRPHLIGISSQAVAAPFTQAEGYGASKAAVQYWLSALRIDLARYHIDVSEILPGFVDTPLTQKNTFSMPFLMSVDNAAKRILQGIEALKWQYAFPKRLSGLLWLARHTPKLWLRLQSRNQSL